MLPMFSFEYPIDIEPSPATELGLKSVLYKKEEEEECTGFMNGKTGTHQMALIIPYRPSTIYL